MGAIEITEPIIAYRSWGFAFSENSKIVRLSTTGIGNFLWTPLKAVPAKCLCLQGEFHKAPGILCNCGYFSMKELENVPQSFVVGRVAIWGKIIEHEDGYRSEFSYPQVLYCEKTAPESFQVRIKELAAQYGCDFNILNDCGYRLSYHTNISKLDDSLWTKKHLRTLGLAPSTVDVHHSFNEELGSLEYVRLFNHMAFIFTILCFVAVLFGIWGIMHTGLFYRIVNCIAVSLNIGNVYFWSRRIIYGKYRETKASLSH